jgi:hypothetical protein
MPAANVFIFWTFFWHLLSSLTPTAFRMEPAPHSRRGVDFAVPKYGDSGSSGFRPE